MRRAWIYLIGCLWGGISSCCMPSIPTNAVHLGVAASAAPVLDSLTTLYQKKQPATIIYTTVRASGQLAAQLQEGLGMDLFIAADTIYTHHLYQQGKGAVAPTTYAYGHLVLWAPQATTLEQAWNGLRQAPSVTLAQPKVAPYGALARRALQERGIWQALQPQLVYGGSVAQVNHYIQTKAVEAALTAHTSQHQLGEGGFWSLPAYELPQAMLLVQPEEGTVSAEAQAFYDFLQSEEAHAIWQHFGYRVPDKEFGAL